MKIKLIDLCRKGLNESLADQNLELKEETAQEIIENSN